MWSDKEGSVAHLYEASSYGQLVVDEPTVLTVNTATDKPSGCPRGQILEDAERLAKEAGVDPTKFSFMEIFFPEAIKCPWAGLAWIGCGHPSRLPRPRGC